LAWEWIAPIVTGTVAVVSIGTTTVLERIRQTREDKIRQEVWGREDHVRRTEFERMKGDRALLALDVLEAKVRELRAEGESARLPKELLWPIADVLRETVQISDTSLRDKVQVVVMHIRALAEAVALDHASGVSVVPAISEGKQLLAAWSRGETLPDVERNLSRSTNEDLRLARGSAR
jgi:hypothetical protein